MKARSVFESIKHALHGFHYVIATQRNARIHAIVTILVILVGLWLKLDIIQWSMVLVAVSLVWITECFNSTLENYFDLIQPETNQFVKNGKDSSAAAVLVAAILSVLLGLLAIGPPLIARVSSILR
jgi:undecaprenol kinase